MGLFSGKKVKVNEKKYNEYKAEEASIAAAIPGILDSFLDGIPIEGGWPYEESLPRDEIDGSLACLKKIDEYLEVLHNNKESIQQQQIVHVVIAAGYYACEVMRKESKGIIGPVYYSDLYIRGNPITDIVEFAYFSAIMLQNNSNNVITMPLNKVGRFINEGPENSLWYFCASELASVKK